MLNFSTNLETRMFTLYFYLDSANLFPSRWDETPSAQTPAGSGSGGGGGGITPVGLGPGVTPAGRCSSKVLILTETFSMQN